MEIDYRAIGKRIRKRRKEVKMSQERLAELIDVSIPHMSNIENGKTKFSLQVLIDLANALDTTPDVLMLDHLKNESSARGMILVEIGRMLEGCTPVQMNLIEETVRTTKGMLQQYERKLLKDEESY